MLSRLVHSVLPEANSQHGLQQLLNIWLDAGAHRPGKHADTRKNGGVDLHGLLPPAQIEDR